jgi:hypothetical protein
MLSSIERPSIRNVIDRELQVLLIDTKPRRGIALRIQIDQEGLLLCQREARGQVHRGGGLPNPAFLVDDRNDLHVNGSYGRSTWNIATSLFHVEQ